jgi:hypothetical protein
MTTGSGHDSALCDHAARHAAEVIDVPPELLRAIMLAETGHVRDGKWQGWPWAVNVGGRGILHADAQAARRAIDAVPPGATENVDIGCFQLNRRWHGHHFPDTGTMLDPVANALHAARFLAALRDELGSWTAAAGAYHSRDPLRATAYAARVARHLPEGGAPDAPPPSSTRGASRGFALLQAEEPQSGPSLFPSTARGSVPIGPSARPLFGGG